jgi:hypothetical protein
VNAPDRRFAARCRALRYAANPGSGDGQATR